MEIADTYQRATAADLKLAPCAQGDPHSGLRRPQRTVEIGAKQMVLDEEDVRQAIEFCRERKWEEQRRLPKLTFHIHIALNSLLSRDRTLFSKTPAEIVEALLAAPDFVRRVLKETSVEKVGLAIYIATVYRPPKDRLN